MVKCPVLWSILGYFGVFNKRASRKSKSPLSLKNQGKSGFLYYGAGRDRTDDPQTASLMLYTRFLLTINYLQLSVPASVPMSVPISE
jgi:hypothetical protein